MVFQNTRLNSPRPIHTYSIVARDPKTGKMRDGVQSHWFSVGVLVSWGETGVGVVATQSFINKSFGLRGLELFKQGKSSQEALEILLYHWPIQTMFHRHWCYLKEYSIIMRIDVPLLRDYPK